MTPNNDDAAGGGTCLRWSERTHNKVGRKTLLGVAVIQNLTCGGIIFGWTAIASTLLVAPGSAGGASLTASVVSGMFVVACSLNLLSPIVLGIILDVFGPRICNVVSLICVATGCLIFGLSSTATSVMNGEGAAAGDDESAHQGFNGFLVGMALIAFGGPGVQNSVFHLCNLFPQRKALATSIISGSFQLSFGVFPLFDVLWQVCPSADFRSLFCAWSCVAAINVVLSVLLWPDTPYRFSEQVMVGGGPFLRRCPTGDNPDGLMRRPSVFIKKPEAAAAYGAVAVGGSGHAETGEEEEKGRVVGDRSLVQQVLSWEYASITIFFTVGSFWANFYMGSLATLLGDSQAFAVHSQHQYLRCFSLMTTGGVFGIPAIGVLMDRKGFAATYYVTITLGVLYSLLMLLQLMPEATAARPYLLIASFAFYAFFRTFLFTFFFSFLGKTLGFRYFGVLAGISFAVAGVVSFAQGGVAAWATGTCHLANDSGGGGGGDCSGGRWATVTALQLLFFIGTFAIPACAGRCRRRRRSRAQAYGVVGGAALDRPVPSPILTRVSSIQGADILAQA